MRNLTRSIIARLLRRSRQQSGKSAADKSYVVRTALELISRDIEEDGYIVTCDEAEALGVLLWSFGHGEEAERLINAHAEYDRCGDAHHTCGVDCETDGSFKLTA
ncbi:hypothetical protein ACWC5I_00045 [Kitasatospora sp. NPDC001574]